MFAEGLAEEDPVEEEGERSLVARDVAVQSFAEQIAGSHIGFERNIVVKAEVR